MTEEKILAVFTDLQKVLQDEMQYKVEIVTLEGRKVLRFAAPLFEDNTGYVLIELCGLGYDHSFELIQIYSTMIMEPGPGLDKLRQVVNTWNLTSVLGAYGIYEELGQLFNKYNVVVGVEDDVDMIFSQVLAALYILMDEMESKLADAIHISSGK